MSPEQLGPAKDGCLKLAYTLRAAREANPGWVVFKLDFRNAFNECDREAFLEFVAREVPCLLPALHAAYGEPSYITALCGDASVRFLAKHGSTQGCNFGPLAFQAALQPTLRQVASDYPGVYVGAIHDDVNVAGPPAEALRAVTQLIELARAVGLTPVGHKFAVLLPQELVVAFHGCSTNSASKRRSSATRCSSRSILSASLSLSSL